MKKLKNKAQHTQKKLRQMKREILERVPLRSGIPAPKSRPLDPIEHYLSDMIFFAFRTIARHRDLAEHPILGPMMPDFHYAWAIWVEDWGLPAENFAQGATLRDILAG